MEMTDKMLVAVHGSYFADNYGDTLLVQLMCDRVAQIVGRDRVYLATEGHRKEQESIDYPVLPKAQRKQATHLIYGGGGYLGERTADFFDNLRWSARNYWRHLAWRREYSNAETAIIGAGFGPLTNRVLRNSIGRLVSESQVVMFRDQESIQFARNYAIRPDGIDQCVDIALGLPIDAAARSGIAIHVDNLSVTEIELVVRCLSAAHPGLRSIDVLFDNPSSLTDEVRSKYSECARNCAIDLPIRPYVDFRTMVKSVAEYTLIVTSKLHVGITCLAQGGSVISVPTHQKTSRLYKQLSIPNFCIPRSDLTMESLGAAILDTSDFQLDRQVITTGMSRIDVALQKFLSPAHRS